MELYHIKPRPVVPFSTALHTHAIETTELHLIYKVEFREGMKPVQCHQSGICYIVGARPLESDLKPCLNSGDCLIAADKGLERLQALNLTPDLVVGDFDSLGYHPEHPNMITLPVEKDDTDTLFALRKGLEQGYRRFVLLGCLGGKLDHTLANLQAINWLTTQGAAGILAGEGTVVTALRNGTLRFPSSMCGTLSVFSCGDAAEGVTLQGLKYPLDGYTMTGTFPIGVSNEFLGTEALVSVRQGALFVLWYQNGEEFYRHLPAYWPEY